MDIAAPHRGVIREKLLDEQPAGIEVELPLLFTNVSTGPTGILDVVVTKVEIGDITLHAFHEPTFHSFATKNSSGQGTKPARSISGELIKERPITFRPDEKGGNSLVIAFEARSVQDDAEAVSSTLKQKHAASIAIDILFANLARLSISIQGDRHPTGVLVPNGIARLSSPRLININLVALCSIAGALLLWNTWLNADVYQQTSAVSQKIVIAITGSLLTFVGLSLERVRAWFTALTDTLALFRYPELHVNPTLLKGLSSPAFLLALFFVAAFSGSVIIWSWSESVSVPPGLSLYDRAQKHIVSNKRIYRRDLRDNRFALICSPDIDEEVSPPIFIAFLGQNGDLKHVTFRAEFHQSFSGAVPLSMEYTGQEWLGNDKIPEDLQVIRDVLCDPYPSEPVQINGRVVKVENTGDLFKEHLVVARQRIWEDQEVFAWLEDFRQRFRGIDHETVFNRRVLLLEELETTLKEHIGERGIVDFGIVSSLTDLYLRQAGTDRKRIIERSILLRSLWRATSETRSRPPQKAELLALSDLAKGLFASDIGWRAERTLLELLLEVQAQNPGTSGNVLHEAAVSGWLSAKNEFRYPKLCDYIVTAAALNALGEPQRRFMAEHWREFRRWAGAKAPLTDWLLQRERIERGDPSSEENRLREHLLRFERRLEIETPVSRVG